MMLGLMPNVGALASNNKRFEFFIQHVAPAGVRAVLPVNKEGDLMVVVQFNKSGSLVQDQPVGWTSLGGVFNGGGVSAAAKISQGNETGTVYSDTDTTPDAAWCVVFSGGWLDLNPVAEDFGSVYTSGNPAPITLTVPDTNIAPMFALAIYVASTAITSNSFTDPDGVLTFNNGSGEHMKMAWKFFGERLNSPTDIVVDMGDEGSDNGMLAMVRPLDSVTLPFP